MATLHIVINIQYSPGTGDRLETWWAINSPNSLVKCLVRRDIRLLFLWRGKMPSM